MNMNGGWVWGYCSAYFRDLGERAGVIRDHQKNRSPKGGHATFALCDCGPSYFKGVRNLGFFCVVTSFTSVDQYL